MLPCTLSMTPSMTGESLSVTCGPTWMPSKRPNISFKIFGVADDMDEPPADNDTLRIATPRVECGCPHARHLPRWTAGCDRHPPQTREVPAAASPRVAWNGPRRTHRNGRIAASRSSCPEGADTVSTRRSVIPRNVRARSIGDWVRTPASCPRTARGGGATLAVRDPSATRPDAPRADALQPTVSPSSSYGTSLAESNPTDSCHPRAAL